MFKKEKPQFPEGIKNLQAEIIRQNKVIQALMNRAESDSSLQGSDFNLFQTAITLEGQVKLRTKELEVAMRENQRITRALRESEKNVRHLAFYDPLTQLGNRRLLESRLDLAMAASNRSQHYGALVFLDLDNFKPINDKYGHDVGDQLLIEVAHRLKSNIREVDTVARIGGDEFVIIIGELGGAKIEATAFVNSFVKKLQTCLAKPYKQPHKHKNDPLVSLEHLCTSSIGVIMFVDNQEEQQQILKWADIAMYQAKKTGRNRVVFFKKDNE